MPEITGGSYMQMPLSNSVAVSQTLQWKSSTFSSSQLLKHREPYPPYAVNERCMRTMPRPATATGTHYNFTKSCTAPLGSHCFLYEGGSKSPASEGVTG